MKVLVVGGSGLLGWQLVHFLKKHDLSVSATYNSISCDEENFFHLDITNSDETDALVEKVMPDVVVLVAAFTNVDACEKDRETAYLVNVSGAEIVASAAERVGAKMVYVSTDYVFSGEEGNYGETDEPDPICYYGVTKLQGELHIQRICSDFIIARTSVLFGLYKPNFVTWILSELNRKKSISVITNQIISPTNTLDFCEQLFALLKANVRGVFHTAGSEGISRFDFAVKTAELFGFNPSLIRPTFMEDMKWVAKRPKDSSLNVSKIAEFKKPYSVKQSLGLLKERFVWVEG